MEFEVFETDEVKDAKRRRTWREKACDWLDDSKDWIVKNRTVIVAVAPVVVAAVGSSVKILLKTYRATEERRSKERYWYDNRLGCYYELRRKPTNAEHIEADRRRRNGESLGQILSDMGLLK